MSDPMSVDYFVKLFTLTRILSPTTHRTERLSEL
jgi:hypothetical protein